MELQYMNMINVVSCKDLFIYSFELHSEKEKSSQQSYDNLKVKYWSFLLLLLFCSLLL